MNNLTIIENVMIKGDLSILQPQQKVEYYAKVCESVGLNPLTKPLEYIRLNGKEVLYATKGATEQLRNIHGISLKIVSREKIEDVYVVTAEASGKDGRCDSATGAVAITGLKGDALANAFMKAETKAKRRVTLSICGLNMLDETEVESIPQQAKQEVKKVITETMPINSEFAEYKNHIENDQAQAPQLEIDPVLGNYNPDYVITIGKKFNGMKMIDVAPKDLESFMNWLIDQANKKGKPLDQNAQDFVDNVTSYLVFLDKNKN